jgi:uncharacterized protein YecE (DUF72 family)
MPLYVGTSGWAYPEWRPHLYPAGVARRRFLEHYSSLLSACEINATFYRAQSIETLSRWAEATPPAFRFAVKAHRRLTHGRARTLDPRWQETLAAWFASLEPLGDHLGPVLLQWPAHRARDDRLLDAALDALPDGLPAAFDFRHPSWDEPEVDSRLARRGATRCLSEWEGAVPVSLPPGPIAYVRLRGDRYRRPARAAWRALLRREAAGRDVYAFAKHEGAPADDPFAGVGLALWLERYKHRR